MTGDNAGENAGETAGGKAGENPGTDRLARGARRVSAFTMLGPMFLSSWATKIFPGWFQIELTAGNGSSPHRFWSDFQESCV